MENVYIVGVGMTPFGRHMDKSDKQLTAIAEELGCTLSQLAIAWCASNPNVSTVITGASNPGQVAENMGALDVLGKLDDEVLDRMKTIARG